MQEVSLVTRREEKNVSPDLHTSHAIQRHRSVYRIPHLSSRPDLLNQNFSSLSYNHRRIIIGTKRKCSAGGPKSSLAASLSFSSSSVSSSGGAAYGASDDWRREKPRPRAMLQIQLAARNDIKSSPVRRLQSTSRRCGRGRTTSSTLPSPLCSRSRLSRLFPSHRHACVSYSLSLWNICAKVEGTLLHGRTVHLCHYYLSYPALAQFLSDVCCIDLQCLIKSIIGPVNPCVFTSLASTSFPRWESPPGALERL